MAAGGLIRVWKRPFRAPAGPIAPLRGARGPPARAFFLRLSAAAVQAPPAPCARRPHCTPAGSVRPTRPALFPSFVRARCAGLSRSVRPQAPLHPCGEHSGHPPGPFPPVVRPRCAGPSRSVRDMYRLVNSHLDFAQILRIFAFAKEGNRRGGCPPAFYKAGSGGIWRRDGQN